ncbi:MAG: bifunctional N-acetylglucosamine-1-phosphate uridyltransferase/glucosamine-1-phosphate acetyltransferase [Planctomycetes bacterium]|nr:bifunctional N-acetylglucosamine-1-phosphate uridyltransferase/glucosamine-1-phosphate acetyltransferase [Planctomycetota bacterium]
MSRPLAVICLAAGLGKRTKVSTPKVLLPVCGRTLVASALAAVVPLQPQRTVVVLHHQKDLVQKSLQASLGDSLRDVRYVDQGTPKGTGHAVQVAMQALGDFRGDVLVVYGDCPLVTTETLRELCALRDDAPCAVLTACPENPTGLGRILRDADGNFVGIREERDCSEEERAIDEINAGFYCFDSEALRPALQGLRPDNAQGEYYLTDAVASFAAAGLPVPTLETGDPTEIQGVNSLADLAMARQILQERILYEHLLNGVLIVDPATTWIDHGVAIGRDTRILPCTVIGTGCVIGQNCEVGPFAHLRAGTVLEDGAEIGNFVEAKKTVMGAGAKAKHLTYLGDTTVGARANIGAGTITANYDGVHKHPTVIGERCFVGSGSVLVAPTELGAHSMTGAGAIVTRGTKVGAGEVWVGVPAKKLKQRELPTGGHGAKDKA